MASYLPPTESLPIFDNTVFDSNNSTALTYATAKKYFITYPSAQGTSTITDLIAGAISYLSPSSGSFFNIGSNQVSGGTIRIGPTGASGVSVHAGNIDCTNNTINNATASNTGNLTLGNLQTSGVLNLATGATRTGNLNINNTAGATNNINIGASGTTTTVNGTVNISSLKTTTLDATADTTAGTTALKIGSNVILGDIEIGNAQTTGDIKIGQSDTSGATITVGTSSTATTINGTLTTSLGTIAGKTSYIEHDTVNPLPTINCSLANLNLTVLFFSGNIPSGTCTLTNIQDNQIINLKNWNTNATPVSITISQSTPSPISLYTYGIDNGVTGSGVTSYSLAQGDSIIIQKASGKIYQFSAGSSFPNGITLPIRTLTPTTSQLGYYLTASVSAIGVTAATLTTFQTTSALAIGIYWITFSGFFNGFSVNTGYFVPTFSTSNVTSTIGSYQIGGNSGANVGYSYSGVIKVTAASGTVTFQGTWNGASCTLSSGSYSLIRIA